MALSPAGRRAGGVPRAGGDPGLITISVSAIDTTTTWPWLALLAIVAMYRLVN